MWWWLVIDYPRKNFEIILRIIRVCFPSQEKWFPAITHPKRMQILWFVSVIDASTLRVCVPYLVPSPLTALGSEGMFSTHSKYFQAIPMPDLLGITWGPLQHMRLRAHDRDTSSTLIGGKRRSSTSSLHTTLEGPTWYVNARWMWSPHGFPHGIQWIMFHGHLDYFQKPPLGGRPNTKSGDYGTPNAHNHLFILFYHAWGPAWIEIHWNSIWARARSHMTSYYTWGSDIRVHDFGGVLGPLFNI